MRNKNQASSVTPLEKDVFCKDDWMQALALLLPLAHGYSFPSCIGYNVKTNLCSGFIRNYTHILPFMSHAYNFQVERACLPRFRYIPACLLIDLVSLDTQDRVYGWTKPSPANNTASKKDLAVDPALQVCMSCQCNK